MWEACRREKAVGALISVSDWLPKRRGRFLFELGPIFIRTVSKLYQAKKKARIIRLFLALVEMVGVEPASKQGFLMRTTVYPLVDFGASRQTAASEVLSLLIRESHEEQSRDSDFGSKKSGRMIRRRFSLICAGA
jgi:hypothetical protein